MFRILSAIFLLSIVLIESCARNDDNALDNFLDTLNINGQFNGNVLVAENGKVIYMKSFGYANFSDSTKNDSQTRFPIASITKAFTATAIFQLVEHGRLNPDDNVNEILPEFPYESIKIRHLLSHTSGLQPYDNYFESIRKTNPERVFTNKDVLKQYKEINLQLFYQPGEDSNYDNINYILLSLIVEKISGLSFDKYLREKIFQPIGMSDTFTPYFTFYNYSEKEKIKLALTYWLQFPYSSSFSRTDTIGFVSSYWHSYNFKGFGEIVSTTKDLLKFDQALYKGEIISPTALKESYTPVNLNDGKLNKGFGTGNSFTCGWTCITDTTMGRLIRASGGMIGLRSTLLRNITKNQTVIMFDNTQNETDDIALDLMKILNGQYVKPYGKSVARAFGLTLENSGIKKAVDLIDSLKNNPLFSLKEDEFNSLGYAFLNSGKTDKAIETFEQNIRLFPESWNVYDSFAEALLRKGEKNEAACMYKKSLDLNPDNNNAKKILLELSKI